MTEPTDKQLPDAQLDEYLKGDSDVSRQYRSLHSAAVPSELDLRVLREAEAAVKPRSSRARPAWVRWTAPLAVAASAVVVLSIVVETGLRDETTVMQAPASVEMMKRRDHAEGAVADPPPAEAKAEAPAPVYIEPVAPEAPVADMAIVVPEVASPAPAPAFVPEPAPPPPAAAAPEADAFARQSANSVAAEAKEDERSSDAAAAAGIQASVAEAERQLQAVTSAKRAREEVRAVMPSRSAISVELKRTYTDPEQWLKDIRQLRKDNKQAEADAEWQRFHAAFPNYPVAETDTARTQKK